MFAQARDGSCEWVHPDAKKEFEQKGKVMFSKAQNNMKVYQKLL